MLGRSVLLCGLFVTMPISAADLTVIIDKVPSHKGSVDIRLHHDSGHEELGVPFLVMRQPVDDQGRSMFKISGLTPGLYAVVAFHDEDDNGSLTRGTFSVKEASAISNLSERPWSPPTFRDTAFGVSESGLTITLDLKL